MQKILLTEAEQYAKRNYRRRIWRRFVRVMACIVVFCTTYALILPAITMEKMQCGLDEHTHSESCYEKVVPESAVSLLCTYESLGVHVHTAECRDSENQLICGQADYLIHTHDASCMDENGTIVCQIPEISEHVHSEDCYRASETESAETVPAETDATEPAHQHGAACYTTQRGTLTCSLSETEGHTHGDACFTQGELVCQLTEQDGHAHGEGCSETVLVCNLTVEPHVHGDSCYRQLVCEVPEGEDHTHTAECSGPVLDCSLTEQPHVHTDACYQTNSLCDLPETEGHAHGVACYEALLTCELAEEAAHAHSDACYETTTVLICGQEETVPAATEETQAATEETQAATEPAPELICTAPAAQVHVHDDSCFGEASGEEDPLTCTLAEGHIHNESCYDAAGELVCKEEENHIHGTLCYGTWELICTQEEHTHNLVCMSDPEADVETPEIWTATFADVVLTGEWNKDVIAIARSQLGYQESTRNYAVMEDGTTIKGYTRYGDWYGIPHGDWCAMFVSFCLHYAEIPQDAFPYDCGCTWWIDALKDPELDLYRPSGEYTPVSGDVIFFDWEGDGLSDHVGLVAEVIPATETEGAKVVTIEGNCSNQVMEKEYTLDNRYILGYGELPEKPLVYVCGLEEHAHGEGCYDAGSNLICELEEHTHDLDCYDLDEEPRAMVQSVIDAIDAMPSYEEIDAKVAEYQEQGDEDGEIAYLEQVYPQVQQVYQAYSALGEELQQYVTNADKLMELEYIWSAEVLATYTKDPTIYQINSYVYSWSSGATMAHGGTVGQALGVSWEFVYWIGVVVEEDSSGNLYVEQIADSGTNKNSLKADSANGFVLLFADGFDEKPIVSVGDFVTVDASIPDKGALKYTESTGVTGGYGKVHFSSTINSITSAAPTPVKTASTKEFVELNLYDYNGYVNANYWAKNNWYPGFQWNGGAYSKTGTYGYRTDYTYSGIGVPYAETDRHVIDSIDFGNSLITNLTYGYGAAGDYTKAINATAVGYADKSKTHPINWLYGNSTEGYTNKPIGYSTTDLTESQNVMKYTLVDGYPALTDGTMLNYLFKDGVPAKKLNTESIDGLFQVNPISGLYYYNCRENHAQYENNKFTVYAQKLTPNFITYPFGNFLPLNSITDSSKATQVGAFNRPGGMRDYVERILLDLENNTEGLDSGWKSSQDQLTAMLEEYKENWLLHPRTLNGTNNTWTNLSPANAIRDYFLGDTAGGGDNPSDNTDFITQPFLNDLYNLDWDVQTNFFFGMEMKMNVMMPKDGLTGKDNGNNSMPWEAVKEGEYAGTFIRGGEPDGIPDYPMVFNFTGDDDVWVYVDGVLFLDLSGIHRHVGGTIDFQTGTVYYFALDTASGDTHQHDPGTSGYYKKFSFKEILSNAGQDTSVLNEKGTFKDYTTHTFNFYYMERGSGSSVCRINFNFPMLRENAITVSKKNVPDDATIKAMGNPDYYFNVIKWDPETYRSDELFIQPNTPYTILDQYGEKVGTGTVDAHGIFTLKAGQTAVFEGVQENAGEYYVQELIKEEDHPLYANKVSVNGEEPLVGGERVNWSARPWYTENPSDGDDYTGPYGHKWYFYSSNYTNSYASSAFFFEMQNGVITKNLGKLSITKQVERYTPPARDVTYYRMYVLLDDIPLPNGMELTATAADGSTRAVTVGQETVEDQTVSYVDILEGETVEIPHIISGTRFTIWESEASASGYLVGYSSDAEGAQTANGKITGIVRVNAHVNVTITNAEKGAQVVIPVTKSFHKFAEGTYSYTFTLTEADEHGNAKEGGLFMEKTVEVNSDNFQFELDPITYLAHQFEGDSAKYYYLIEEKGETPDNTQLFLVEVTVTRNDDGSISAAVTAKSQKNGESWEAVEKIVFVNILTGDLSLEKKLVGTDIGQQFSFTIKLDPGETGIDLSSMQFTVTGTNADGTDFADVITAAGKNYLICHGEHLTIHGIPLGVKWTITENTTDGYLVTTKVGEVTGESAETSGVITSGNTQVVYTNTQTYVLPETGGSGTIPYTMAGLVLILCSMAYLMYRPKARGRGSYRSS